MNNWHDFVGVLLRRWPIVLAMAILAVATALVVSLLTKPVYEATAVVGLAPESLSVPAANQSPPYYLMVDASSRLPIAHTPAYYVALLESAVVVKAVAPTAAVIIGADGDDKSLIRITARGQDPSLVAQTANKWAEVGAAHIAEDLLPATDELASAKEKLTKAEEALIKFAQDNKLEYDPAKLQSTPDLAPDKRLELDWLLRARSSAETVYLEFARDYERSTLLTEGGLKPSVMPAPVPTVAISPNLRQGVLVGAVLGLLIGVLGAFGVELVSRK